MTSTRLERQKIMAKTWAINMGMLPHKDNSGKLVFGTEFMDNNGQLVSRKKTVKGKLNPNAFLHKPTTGVAITRKYLNMKKKKIRTKPKQVLCEIEEYVKGEKYQPTLDTLKHYDKLSAKQYDKWEKALYENPDRPL